MADRILARLSSGSSPFLPIPTLSGRAMTIALHNVQPLIKHGRKKVLAQDRIMGWASGVIHITMTPMLRR